MLAADGVSKHFSGITALEDVDMRLDAGETLGLVGPNGSGKSTLLNVLSGFIRPERGRVTFRGERIDRRRPWAIAERGLERTFQLPAQPQRLTVLEVMLTGAHLPRGETVWGSLLSPRRVRAEQAAAVERARGLLDELTLLELEHHAAGTLSGGQQKLLSLGVALMGDPEVLLLDEPTAGVHRSLRHVLVERLRSLHEAGTALVIVEHDIGFVTELCDRVYVLDKGRVITSCVPKELASDPRVVEAYLGTKKRPTAASTTPASHEQRKVPS